MAQQYLMTAPVVVPAPVLMEVVAQVQHGNHMLRKESHARNAGVGRLVDSVNINMRRVEALLGMAQNDPAGRAMLERMAEEDRQMGNRLGFKNDLMSPGQNAAYSQYDQNGRRRQGGGLYADVAHYQGGVGVQSTSGEGAPGLRHDPRNDIRMLTWNVRGLLYKNGDTGSSLEAVEAAAESVWSCSPDLIALQGLQSRDAAFKISELFNRWSQHPGDKWQHATSPRSVAQAGSGPAEYLAFIWRSPRVVPFDQRDVREYGFQILENSSHFNLACSPFYGVLQIGHRPLLVMNVHVPPTRAHADGKYIRYAIESAAEDIQRVHSQTRDKLVMAIMGDLNQDAGRTMDSQQWSALLPSKGLARTGDTFDDILISKHPFGEASSASRNPPFQPVSIDGSVGEVSRPPYRA
eukprot:gene2003-33428_t